MENKWVLEDNKHPRFNRWRHTTSSGASYCECFGKNIDPNRNLEFDENPYNYRIEEMGLIKKEIAKEIGLGETTFYNILNGKTYFTREELTKLNKILGFEDYGDRDVRVEVNPTNWIGKKVGHVSDDAELLEIRNNKRRRYKKTKKEVA